MAGKSRKYMASTKLVLSCSLLLVQRGHAEQLMQQLISSALGKGFEPAVFFERHRGDEAPFAKVRIQTNLGSARVHVADQGEQRGDEDP
eukprot:4596255-Pyramimonas_sp.AAC.1